jgi:hypothetical protein
VGNGKPADEGRAGTVSPTHPHNERSLDGHNEMGEYASKKDMKKELEEKKRKIKI